jgi:hypothetical protein
MATHASQGPLASAPRRHRQTSWRGGGSTCSGTYPSVKVSAEEYQLDGSRGRSLAIRLPTDEDEELVRRFTVVLNHIDHVRLWLEHEYGAAGEPLYEGLTAATISLPAFHRVKRRDADVDAIRGSLSISWMSELQLLLPSVLGTTGLMRYSNAWAPVHAYYAAYMSLQAWFQANGISGVADDHSASLRTVATQIRDRRLFPEPWSVLAIGCATRGAREYLNAPAGANVTGHVETLADPRLEDFWPRYGTWLRSTRKARLTAREDEWKRRHGRRRISPKVRDQYARTLWPTSLFDCLWRLRIRSNYRTVEPYLVRFVSDDSAERFHNALVVCSGATLLLLELYTARAIGGKSYSAVAAAFQETDQHGLAASTLGPRLAAIRNVAPFLLRIA